MLGPRLALVLAVVIAAGCGSKYSPNERAKNFAALPRYPGIPDVSDKVTCKRLDGKLLFRRAISDVSGGKGDFRIGEFSPSSVTLAKATDWDRAESIIRDAGPQLPGEHFDLPQHGQHLAIDGRSYRPRGARWLHVLFSTDGAHVALFTETKYDVPPPPKQIILFGIPINDPTQRIGDLFVEVYRRSDGELVAAMNAPVMRYSYFHSDSPSDWVQKAAWYGDTFLIVPVEHTPYIASLPRQKPMPLPFKDCQSLCGDGMTLSTHRPPSLRISAARYEGVDRDRNRRLESVLVRLTVEPEIPGKYAISANFDGIGAVLERFPLRSSPQEITFELGARRFRSGPKELRLIGATYWHRQPYPVDDKAAPESARMPTLPLSPYSLPAFETRAAYLVRGPTPQRWQIPPPNPAGPHLLIDIQVFSRESAECIVRGYLRSVGKGSEMAVLAADAHLKPGYNTVTLHSTQFKTETLWGGPHAIEGLNLSFRGTDEELELGGFPIEALDFRGIPGLRCMFDLNADGRVDELDVAPQVAQLQKSDKEFFSRLTRAQHEDILNRTRRVVLENSNCRTK